MLRKRTQQNRGGSRRFSAALYRRRSPAARPTVLCKSGEGNPLVYLIAEARRLRKKYKKGHRFSTIYTKYITFLRICTVFLSPFFRRPSQSPQFPDPSAEKIPRKRLFQTDKKDVVAEEKLCYNSVIQNGGTAHSAKTGRDAP